MFRSFWRRQPGRSFEFGGNVSGVGFVRDEYGLRYYARTCGWVQGVVHTCGPCVVTNDEDIRGKGRTNRYKLA